MWESQVLLTDGQVVFPRVLRFSPTFDERSARYKWNILERAIKPKSKKKKKKKKKLVKLLLHTNVGYDNILSKFDFQGPGLKVKDTVASLEQMLSLL